MEKIDLVISKSTELDNETKSFYNILKSKFGYSARMTSLIQLLEAAIDYKFEDLDYNYAWTPEFLSYFLDRQNDFCEGKDINVSLLLKDIEKQFELSKTECKLLERKKSENAIWAIFLIITDPFHESYII